MKVMLDNIESNLKEEIIKSLEEILNKYPKIINRINLITDFNTINEYLLNNYRYKRVFDSDTAFTSVFIESNDLFIILGINNSYTLEEMNKLLSESYKSNWTYSRCIKDALYHELGHIFSHIYNLTSNKDFMTIINSFNECIPGYAYNNIEELTSECFTKYSYDKDYNDLVNFIGTVIDKVYDRVENKDISSKILKKY